MASMRSSDSLVGKRTFFDGLLRQVGDVVWSSGKMRLSGEMPVQLAGLMKNDADADDEEDDADLDADQHGVGGGALADADDQDDGDGQR